MPIRTNSRVMDAATGTGRSTRKGRVHLNKKTHTYTDTILITQDIVHSWKPPPFQRPLRTNQKVRELADMIKQDGGVIPGVVTLGILGSETYLLDGQHRLHGWELTEILEGYADVRVHQFNDMAEMGREFVNLNSRLVTLRPDDILRGLEQSLDALRTVRRKCPFVGYDSVRRGARGTLLSMSVAIRAWTAAKNETPTPGGRSAMQLAVAMTNQDASELSSALNLLFDAWGRDPEYFRLWSRLNLSLCLWIYRRTVLGQHSGNATQLTRDIFRKCAMSLSATRSYLDWLVGRNAGERDRSPAYTRLRSIFAKRYREEMGQRLRFPGPAWSKSH